MQPERHVELGVRGDAKDVVTAIQELQEGVTGLGFNWSAAAPRGAVEKKPA
jgi:hypothetical protein